ncbi:GNAT family N-acetyltransferase [Dysgonomonas sp. Marseille-P4361]|uniref:GNAT family N-acetyltransferase n=1 Tax=Dysgonomonas sp. Marseille-P4361 TaxID=2161820 RepID=UPI0021011AF6|nr:GNAT family N-acetyltransferase [Dysgonomonas sp. Marseille-P4361]
MTISTPMLNLKNTGKVKIKLYTTEDKDTWDTFVRSSKNATFLLYRDFIEYHRDRFKDYSLLFYIDNKLVAILPGHIVDKVYYSHMGLTYGGLIMSQDTTASQVLMIFEYLTVTFRHQGIRKIIYKSIPHIYHRQPAEEDLYALFRYKAYLSSRGISSTVYNWDRVTYSDSRKNGLKKANKNNIKILINSNLVNFWNIVDKNLKNQYNKKPVHSLEEITYLQEKFPDNIKLYTAVDKDDSILGGCLTFETDKVVHAQYTAATEEGKNQGAIDLVIDHIINIACSNKKIFDYGISTEDNGYYLNESLIYQKEGFGARATVYDTYTIDL